jgi:hypothetical protein
LVAAPAPPYIPLLNAPALLLLRGLFAPTSRFLKFAALAFKLFAVCHQCLQG